MADVAAALTTPYQGPESLSARQAGAIPMGACSDVILGSAGTRLRNPNRPSTVADNLPRLLLTIGSAAELRLPRYLTQLCAHGSPYRSHKGVDDGLLHSLPRDLNTKVRGRLSVSFGSRG